MSDGAFGFEVHARSGRARRGTLTTPHGEVPTPIFMPVGTSASVKGLGPDDLLAVGAHIVLGNTYHLMLRPGADRLERFGGLHEFMKWPRPMLTDSGGFQVFSLASGMPRGDSKKAGNKGPLVKIDDDGVTFKSHLDGSKHRMTPEASMDIQMKIGADIIMAFDVCPPGTAGREEVRRSMKLTTAWLDRCIKAMTREKSRLFGIVQGGVYDDLRIEHAKTLQERNLFGYAIGGLSVGEKKSDMMRVLEVMDPVLPQEKPRYLMGVGTPDDLLDGVERGVDMFDCVMPTRNGRNGTIFTSRGRLSIKRAAFTEDMRPLDEQCECYACRTFSRAYLRHLYLSRELLFFRLASIHNVAFYLNLMAEARLAIEEDRFAAFAAERRAAHQGDPAQ